LSQGDPLHPESPEQLLFWRNSHMTLTWQPIDNAGAADGSPFVIASTLPTRGAGSKVVLSTQFIHSRAAESVQYPRAESADFFDRANASTTLQAVVHYEFASVRECGQFQARLGNALGGRGDLTIEYGDGGEDTLPRAVWSSIQVSPKLGIATTIAFTFTGGAINS
jgi:hypothetical protein